MAKTKTKSEKPQKGASGAPPKEQRVAQAGTKAGGAEASESATPARPRVGPFKFLQQVRTEVSKVTWPTWKETYVTTIMVFVMVILCAMFFFLVDQLLGTAVHYVLQLAS
jgi:preprotein translocase subunit SecE